MASPLSALHMKASDSCKIQVIKKIEKARSAMPKKILIIDDDPVIVKYLKAVFSDNGYAPVVPAAVWKGWK